MNSSAASLRGSLLVLRRFRACPGTCATADVRSGEPDRAAAQRLLLAILASSLLHALVAVTLEPAFSQRSAGARRAGLTVMLGPINSRPELFSRPADKPTDARVAVEAQAPGARPGASVSDGNHPVPDRTGDVPLPPKYYTAQEVDIRATPVNLTNRPRTPENYPLGRLVTAKLRLFISEDGYLDRVELIEAAGLVTPEMLDDLHEIRFHPALKDGHPVRSLKLIEVSFLP